MSFYKYNCSPEQRVRAMKGPPMKADCEIIMIVGLPGVGKTTWGLEMQRRHPEKRYNIIGTDTLIDKMRVNGLPRRRNYHGRWDSLIKKATQCLNKLFEIGSKRKRNFILDQTNVYPSAQRRKMRPFTGFFRRAAVLVSSDEELKRRSDKRTREDGKEVPEAAVLEMMANFELPEESQSLEFVDFMELSGEQAVPLVARYNAEAKQRLQGIKHESKEANPSPIRTPQKAPKVAKQQKQIGALAFLSQYDEEEDEQQARAAQASAVKQEPVDVKPNAGGDWQAADANAGGMPGNMMPGLLGAPPGSQQDSVKMLALQIQMNIAGIQAQQQQMASQQQLSAAPGILGPPPPQHMPPGPPHLPMQPPPRPPDMPGQHFQQQLPHLYQGEPLRHPDPPAPMHGPPLTVEGPPVHGPPPKPEEPLVHGPAPRPEGPAPRPEGPQLPPDGRHRSDRSDDGERRRDDRRRSPHRDRGRDRGRDRDRDRRRDDRERDSDRHRDREGDRNRGDGGRSRGSRERDGDRAANDNVGQTKTEESSQEASQGDSGMPYDWAQKKEVPKGLLFSQTADNPLLRLANSQLSETEVASCKFGQGRGPGLGSRGNSPEDDRKGGGRRRDRRRGDSRDRGRSRRDRSRSSDRRGGRRDRDRKRSPRDRSPRRSPSPSDRSSRDRGRDADGKPERKRRSRWDTSDKPSDNNDASSDQKASRWGNLAEISSAGPQQGTASAPPPTTASINLNAAAPPPPPPAPAGQQSLLGPPPGQIMGGKPPSLMDLPLQRPGAPLNHVTGSSSAGPTPQETKEPMPHLNLGMRPPRPLLDPSSQGPRPPPPMNPQAPPPPRMDLAGPRPPVNAVPQSRPHSIPGLMNRGPRPPINLLQGGPSRPPIDVKPGAPPPPPPPPPADMDMDIESEHSAPPQHLRGSIRPPMMGGSLRAPGDMNIRGRGPRFDGPRFSSMDMRGPRFDGFDGPPRPRMRGPPPLDFRGPRPRGRGFPGPRGFPPRGFRGPRPGMW